MTNLRFVMLLAISLALVGLVAVAIAGKAGSLAAAIVLSTALASIGIRRLFPASGLIAVTFTGLAAIYASIFELFVEGFFGGVSESALGLGFATPILLFVFGLWLHSGSIRAVLKSSRIGSERGLLRAFAWLVPVFLVGTGVYAFSGVAAAEIDTNLVFTSTMGLIGVIVLLVSKHVALFLVDIGLLFDEFLSRISRLTIPAFAFLTFYALLVIFFGAIYSIISQHAPGAHFRVNTVERSLTFLEAIYFSIVTMSTVGYGDIVPASNLTRVIASVQVLFGVLLLLFGVSELLEYTREHRVNGKKSGLGG